EAVPAAARAHRVRVLDREPTTHQLIDVVDLRAFQVLHRVRVDVDLQAAVDVDDVIVLTRRVLVEAHAVRESGATPGRDEDPEPKRLVDRLIGDEALELAQGGVGDGQDAGGDHG